MSLRKLWNETVAEGIPDEFQTLLDKLPCLSEGGAEAGEADSGRSYSAGQDIRHVPPVTLIRGSGAAQSHNLNGTVSTPPGEGGSK